MDAKVEHVSKILKDNRGELVGEIEKMGKRRLAYEIGDLREGYYVVMKFRGEPAAAKELERQLRLDENVIRALLINVGSQAQSEASR